LTNTSFMLPSPRGNLFQRQTQSTPSGSGWRAHLGLRCFLLLRAPDMTHQLRVFASLQWAVGSTGRDHAPSTKEDSR